MRFSSFSLVILIAALLPVTSRAVGADPTLSKEALRELQARASAIPTLRLDADPAQLSPIGAAIGNARVVGMGEGNRGSSQVLAFEKRLFIYLVERKGFTVLALEASWGSGRLVDRYIKGGSGTAEEAATGLRVSKWNVPQMLDLIEWMRAYNAKPGNRQSLSFAGFDMHDPTGPANYLIFALTYGGTNPASTKATLSCVLSPNLPRLQNEPVARACRERIAALQPQVSNIADVNTRNIAQSALLNLLEYIDASAVRVKDNVRDPAMARNVISMATYQFADQKIALWAHGVRLDKAKSNGATIFPMGYYLRERFGSTYYSIGQMPGNGMVRSVAFLDLRSLPRSSALDRYVRHTGLANTYDGIVYSDGLVIGLSLLQKPTVSRSLGESASLPRGSDRRGRRLCGGNRWAR